jgi:L-fuculose-phosphate aldolase
MLFENHGAVTFGKNITGAYFRMEKLEHTARIIITARSIGREKSIPLNKLRELYNISEEVYGIKIDRRNRMDK